MFHTIVMIKGFKYLYGISKQNLNSWIIICLEFYQSQENNMM